MQSTINTARYSRPRRRGTGIYFGVVIVVAVIAMVWQNRWMKQAKSEIGVTLAPNSFAEKAGDWMLKKRGMSPETVQGTVTKDLSVTRLECYACEGLGATYDAAGRRQPCPICQGVGFRMIRPFDAQDVPCPACGGMGRMENLDGNGEVQTCTRCDGRGFIREPDVKEKETAATDETSSAAESESADE